MRKNILFLPLIFIFTCFTLVGSNFTVNAEQTTTKGTITALGDSIATGYLLDDPTTQGYPYKIANYMNMNLNNAAINGETTSELLTLLDGQDSNSEGSHVVEYVSNADIVTVSIGGNNLLHPTVAALNMGVPGGDVTKASFSQIISATLALASGSQYQYLSDNLKLGVDSFNNDFPEIIKKIHTINPNAKICVSTIANPIEGLYPNAGTQKLQEAIDSINNIIKNQSANGDYLVADVDGLSKNIGRLSITNLLSKNDIHPNIYGHNIIFLANYYALNKSYPYKISSDIKNGTITVDYNTGSAVPKITVVPDKGYTLPNLLSMSNSEGTTYLAKDSANALEISPYDLYGDITIHGDLIKSADYVDTSTVTQISKATATASVSTASISQVSTSTLTDDEVAAVGESTIVVAAVASADSLKTSDSNSKYIKVALGFIITVASLIFVVYLKKRKVNL